MFTGLIEEIGTIRKVTSSGDGLVIELTASQVLENTRIGDSISINGACQTVVELGNSFFAVFASRVTAEITTLGSFKPGTRVNLERAMALGGRFGGHIVQGHIDGVGIIREINKDTNGSEIIIEVSPEIHRYIVAKGSIAVDGISLTVVSVLPDAFSLYIIPESLNKTIIPLWKPGQTVNLETDIFAKYIEKFISSSHDDTATIMQDESELKRKLAEGGYI